MRRIVLLLAIVWGIVALSACQASSAPTSSATELHHVISAAFLNSPQADGWPTFGYNAAHTGSVASSIQTRPISGKVLWSHKFGPIFSSSVVGLGLLYIASTDGYLYALKQDSGAIVWRANVGSHLTDATPTLEGRVLFIALRSNALEALNALTGQVYWIFHAAEKIQAPPLAMGERVFLASLTTLWTLDATNGQLLWKFHHGVSGWPTSAAPTVVGDTVFVGMGTGNQVWALAVKDGSTRWSFDTGDRITSTIVGGTDSVYVATWHGAIFALDRTRGTKRWAYYLNQNRSQSVVNGVGGNIALADGRLYFGDYRGTVLCMDAIHGEVIWQYATGAQILSTPIIASGSVYIGSGDGYLYALDTRTGRPHWRYRVGETRSAASLASGHLSIGSIDGMMYAFS